MHSSAAQPFTDESRRDAHEDVAQPEPPTNDPVTMTPGLGAVGQGGRPTPASKRRHRRRPARPATHMFRAAESALADAYVRDLENQ